MSEQTANADDWTWCTDQQLRDHIALQQGTIRDCYRDIREARAVIIKVEEMLAARGSEP